MLFIDPCKPNPCYRGNKCTPLSDTKFKCADCPRGFAGDGVTCSPVNEVGCITLNRQVDVLSFHSASWLVLVRLLSCVLTLHLDTIAIVVLLVTLATLLEVMI